ncbi:MAG: hypothetical protein RL179_1956, partial [Planctomycetota bacterium]
MTAFTICSANQLVCLGQVSDFFHHGIECKALVQPAGDIRKMGKR